MGDGPESALRRALHLWGPKKGNGRELISGHREGRNPVGSVTIPPCNGSKGQPENVDRLSHEKGKALTRILLTQSADLKSNATNERQRSRRESALVNNKKGAERPAETRVVPSYCPHRGSPPARYGEREPRAPADPREKERCQFGSTLQKKTFNEEKHGRHNRVKWGRPSLRLPITRPSARGPSKNETKRCTPREQ